MRFYTLPWGSSIDFANNKNLLADLVNGGKLFHA